MEQFYVTLPSNTKNEPINKPSEFSVRLPQKLQLVGEWECGLCQIIYPHNWTTLGKAESVIKIKTKDDEKLIKIPIGCYDSVNEYINVIQHTLKQEGVNFEKGIHFTYSNILKRVHIKIVKEYAKSVTLSKAIADILGFTETHITLSFTGSKEPEFKGGVDCMYIYANILQPQIVGDIFAPLLRIVNVEGSYPNIIDKTFDFPHYVPILVKNISEIEINIKDDQNNFVNFITGKVIIKLHFRKTKQYLF